MSEIVEHFEKKARFKDEKEAELIREKLEELVTNILTQVEKRDKRFQSTLIHSGSVYEEVKVRQPDEFDFMIRIDSLTDKPSFHSCDKGEGYAKLVLEEQGWKEFEDDEGYFNPNLFSHYFKKLVKESLSDTEVPEGLVIQRTHKDLVKESWWPVYSDALGNKGGQENPSGLVYSETHGPATTLDIAWQGGDSYKNMKINVDLTPTLDCRISQLPVQLAELPQETDAVLRKCGFHVVPAGFDSWRISFSMAEKEILVSSPDGFKACYRILKVIRDDISSLANFIRDDISEMLGWNPSLVPSYMLKTVLLCELIRTDCHLWGKQYWLQRITQVLELVLEGVRREEIRSFFIPGHNLLTVSDHENKLRLCVVEEMLNQIKGQQLAYTPEKVRERKQQAKVLQLIDLLEYMFSCLLGGKDLASVWNMMFVNIGNVPRAPYYSRSGENWTQITDLNTTCIDEDTYWHLIAISRIMEEFFKQLLATLRGELNLVAQKFKIFVNEKRRKFELEHKGLASLKVKELSFHEFAARWFLEDIVDNYTEDDNSTLSSVRKVIPPGFIVSGFFHDVADVTMREGSERGLALFKQRFKEYLFKIPKSYLISGIVGYVSEIIVRAKDVMTSKLAHIEIPELDLDEIMTVN